MGHPAGKIITTSSLHRFFLDHLQQYLTNMCLLSSKLTNTKPLTKLTASICDADFIDEHLKQGTVRSRSDLSTYETSSI